MERVFGLKPFKHRRAHINPKMAEGNVPLLRSKADERQRLSGGGHSADDFCETRAVLSLRLSMYRQSTCQVT